MPVTNNNNNTTTSVTVDDFTFSIIIDPRETQGKHGLLPLKDVEVKDGYALISTYAIYNALFSFHLESESYKGPLLLVVTKNDKKVDEVWVNFSQDPEATEDDPKARSVEITRKTEDKFVKNGKFSRKEFPLKFGRKSANTKPETYDIVLYKAIEITESTPPAETVNKVTGKRKNRPDEPSPLFNEVWESEEFGWSYVQSNSQKRFGSRRKPTRKGRNGGESANFSKDDDDLRKDFKMAQSWENPMAVFRINIDYPWDLEEPVSVSTQSRKTRSYSPEPASAEPRTKRRRIDGPQPATTNHEDENEERNSQMDPDHDKDDTDSDSDSDTASIIPFKVTSSDSKKAKRDNRGDDNDVEMTDDDDKEDSQSQNSGVNLGSDDRRRSRESSLSGRTLINGEDESTPSIRSTTRSRTSPNRITKPTPSKERTRGRGPMRLRKPAFSEDAAPNPPQPTLNDVLENLREAEAFRKRRDEALQRHDERRIRKLEESNASLQEKYARLEKTLEENEEELDDANREVQRLNGLLTVNTNLEETNEQLKQKNGSLEEGLQNAQRELEKAQEELKELKRRNSKQLNAENLEETLKRTQQALKESQKQAQAYKQEAETHKKEKATLLSHLHLDAQSKIERYRQDITRYDRVPATPQL